MYAIIETGGKQYRVSPGDEVDVELLHRDPGETVVWDRVYLVADDEGKVHVGTPLVEGARVTGQVVGEGRGPKIRVFKYKPKVNYRRRMGHRQGYTRVRVEEITLP